MALDPVEDPAREVEPLQVDGPRRRPGHRLWVGGFDFGADRRGPPEAPSTDALRVGRRRPTLLPAPGLRRERASDRLLAGGPELLGGLLGGVGVYGCVACGPVPRGGGGEDLMPQAAVRVARPLRVAVPAGRLAHPLGRRARAGDEPHARALPRDPPQEPALSGEDGRDRLARMLGGQRAVESLLGAGPAQPACPCDERPGDRLADGRGLLEEIADLIGPRPVGGAPHVAVGRPGHRHDDLTVRVGPQVGEACVGEPLYLLIRRPGLRAGGGVPALADLREHRVVAGGEDGAPPPNRTGRLGEIVFRNLVALGAHRVQVLDVLFLREFRRLPLTLVESLDLAGPTTTLVGVRFAHFRLLSWECGGPVAPPYLPSIFPPGILPGTSFTPPGGGPLPWRTLARPSSALTPHLPLPSGRPLRHHQRLLSRPLGMEALCLHLRTPSLM